MITLSGRAVRDARKTLLEARIKSLSFVPRLAIIQVGDRADSTAYIRAKQMYAQKIGVETQLIRLPETASQEEIVTVTDGCNSDSRVHGIVVQLPLPEGISKEAVIGAIAPAKDVDGLTAGARVIPATARGVKELLDFYKISLAGKKVAVVGRSRLVGAPIARFCKDAGAHVIICHSQTSNLAHETAQADILIVAVGRKGLIGSDHVRQGQIVIDVGISKDEDGTLKGDVDIEAVRGMVAAITPVPGGVGPMTVLALFENLIDLCTM